MDDTGIVRNRAKILATITNARAALDVDLDELIWSFAPPPRPRVRERGALPALTDESKALAKALKQAGFVFVGPTTVYSTDAGVRRGRRSLRGLPCLSA